MWKKDTDDSAIGNPAMARTCQLAAKVIRAEVLRDGWYGKAAETEFEVRYADWLMRHRPRKRELGD